MVIGSLQYQWARASILAPRRWVTRTCPTQVRFQSDWVWPRSLMPHIPPVLRLVCPANLWLPPTSHPCHRPHCGPRWEGANHRNDWFLVQLSRRRNHSASNSSQLMKHTFPCSMYTWVLGICESIKKKSYGVSGSQIFFSSFLTICTQFLENDIRKPWTNRKTIPTTPW